MANCRIKPFTEPCEGENLPRRGLVNDVCREWLVHEDKALAYRLQDEEYQHHLGNNKERNALLRQDTPKAKEEQLREDQEAAKVQNAIELNLARQEARDASVAHAIAAELDRIEVEKQRQQELEDRLFAKSLMEHEKKKVRQTKEIRQVEREAAYLGINSGLDNVALLSRKEKRTKSSSNEAERNSLNSSRDESSPSCAPSPPIQDLSDLSDFCLKPTSSMDEDEMRKLQEEQDEELARLLQEQDLKRRGDLLQSDQLNAIEVQDRELAKVLQEQERAKAKKTREKARQKALLKKRANHSAEEESDIPPSKEDVSRNTSLEDSNHYESPRYDVVSPESPPRSSSPKRSNSPHYATPSFDILLQPRATSPLKTSPPNSSQSQSHSVYSRPMKIQDPVEPRKIDEHPSRETRQYTHRRNDPNFDSPHPTYTNIACAIDPTYQRRVMRGEISPSRTVNPSSIRPASPTVQLSSKAHIHSSQSPVPSGSYPEEEEEDDYLPPPYMPIQGQRRLAQLEKKSPGSKNSKDKSPKENTSCKQQ